MFCENGVGSLIGKNLKDDAQTGYAAVCPALHHTERYCPHWP
jgi:hypothetical protein